MARAQLHHTRQVDERRVRRAAWPRKIRSTATGGMHRHRDHGMGAPKSSAQRRIEWPRERHLRAPSFRRHVRHKGGTGDRHKGGTRDRASARKIVGEPWATVGMWANSWVGHSARVIGSSLVWAFSGFAAKRT